MDSAHSEVELKLYCADLMQVQRRLQRAGARLVAARVLERNLRYDRADGGLDSDGIVLRLRQDSRARLTLKMPGDSAPGQDAILQRFEAEVEVSDFDTRRSSSSGSAITCNYITRSTARPGPWAAQKSCWTSCPAAISSRLRGTLSTSSARYRPSGWSRRRACRSVTPRSSTQIQAHLGLPLHELTFEAFASITLPPNFFADLAVAAGNDA